MKDFDAVVIGAGLGGIAAATSLAEAGKRVLLMEKHNVPGGYVSSFVRGRFEFEVALHALSGLGKEEDPGPIWKLLKSNEVAKKLDFLYIPEFYKAYYPDFTITLPIGREKYKEAMCNQFPEEAAGLRKFVDIMWEFADQALKANRIGMKAVMQDPTSFNTLMTYYGKTLSQVLNPLVADERSCGGRPDLGLLLPAAFQAIVPYSLPGHSLICKIRRSPYQGDIAAPVAELYRRLRRARRTGLV